MCVCPQSLGLTTSKCVVYHSELYQQDLERQRGREEEGKERNVEKGEKKKENKLLKSYLYIFLQLMRLSKKVSFAILFSSSEKPLTSLLHSGFER